MTDTKYYQSHKCALKTLHRSVATLTQGVSYTETVQCEGFKLKVFIESDAYQSQCRAHIDVWAVDDLKWNRLAMIPYSEMKTRANLLHVPDNGGKDPAHFKADREDLLKQAMDVLDLAHGQWALNPAVAAFIEADNEGEGFDLRVTTTDGSVLEGPCSPPTSEHLRMVKRGEDGSDCPSELVPLNTIAEAEIVW